MPGIHISQMDEPALSPRAKDIVKPTGEWNDLEVECLGETVTVRLNGEVINRLNRARENEGWIGLAPQGSDVQIRSVRVAKRLE